jgi:glycogen synthase
MKVAYSRIVQLIHKKPSLNWGWKRMRVFYLTGPADIVSDYRAWANPRGSTASFGAGIFIEQFFQFCKEIDARGHIVSTASGTNAALGPFVLEYRNPNVAELAGLRYHIRMICYMIGIINSIIKFKPDLVLVAVADPYWFTFYTLYFSRVTFVPFFHCALWPRLKAFDELSFAQRTLLRLTGSFLRTRCKAILSITDVLKNQLSTIVGSRGPKIVQFRPIYEPDLFKDVAPPDWEKRPFRVLFAGNVSRPKGIYSIIEVAKRLINSNADEFVFDVCGTGEELPTLRKLVEQEQLTNVFLHGQCDRPTLKSLYSRSHVIMVPTTRDFPEGFNRVSIESILCGRPVIASTAVIEPAISSAAIKIDPNDIDGFHSAVIRLRNDRNYYENLCKSALQIQGQFFDKGASWENGLRRIISAHLWLDQ